MNLTATQLIKKAILARSCLFFKDFKPINSLTTGEEIDAAFEDAEKKDVTQDATEEIRSSGIETGLPAPFSRNYETEINAHLIDGQYVGFVYYFAGGKYGEPGAIPWMDDAFFLDCKEELVTATKRTFTKKN